MNSVTLNGLLDLINTYNSKDVEKIKKAYEYAKTLHNGQVRQSGEEYITHPLNVAYILAEMHADSDTICAGLLHDTLEDTNITKEDIAHDFNPQIASLVDGVTKLSKMNFSSKEEQNFANTRKIITSISDDVRIIIIKLADRLHNMRTLKFKSAFKQKENSIETMEIFVPLAYLIGAYRIKSELEDISFRYLKPDKYKEIEEKKLSVEENYIECANEMLYKISRILNDREIPNEIKIRIKNIYGIYKRMCEGNKINDIHDLVALKVIVDEIDNCYITLGLIHREYKPINSRFKDYISCPKTNMYSSLHSTVFGPSDTIIQTQIRTFDMDKIASFGLTAYFDTEKGNARETMQKALNEKFQFYKSLSEIDSTFSDNRQFVNQVKYELFSSLIYVYNSNGDVIELPIGSTVIDFAYKLGSEIGNTLVGAVVNDKFVSVDTILHNKDRVKVITNELSFGPRLEWENKVRTSYARTKIKDFYNG
ncbi:MAG: RelA/SpoT family protein [bacterium]|nr:RelA/SpoT family protein [bacterium]